MNSVDPTAFSPVLGMICKFTSVIQRNGYIFKYKYIFKYIKIYIYVRASFIFTATPDNHVTKLNGVPGWRRSVLQQGQPPASWASRSPHTGWGAGGCWAHTSVVCEVCHLPDR